MAARRGRPTESASRSFAGRAIRSACRRSRATAALGIQVARVRWRSRALVAADAATAVVVAAEEVVARRMTRRRVRIDGLYRAAFPGGSTLAFMIADVATGKAQEFWHNQPNDRVFGNINAITWAGQHVVFNAQVPNDEWDRYYSVAVDGSQSAPTLLTTTDGLINDSVADRTFVTTALSRDGKTLYYCTNAKDIEKRHIWAVPTCRRHADADLHRRRRGSLADAARVGQESGGAVFRRQRAGVGRHRADRRRRDEGRVPVAQQGVPAGGARDAGDRDHARGRRFRGS